MKGRVSGCVLLLLLLISVWGNARAEEAQIRIIQNGQTVEFQEAEGRIFIDANGRTLVPVRKVAELLGAEVGWIPDTRTVTVKKDGILLQVKIGEQAIRSGTKVILMDTAAQILDGRTYLPLRAVSESLNYRVLWDPVKRTIGFETAASASVMAGGTQSSQLEAPKAGDSVALMKTSMGDIRIKLLKAEAPKAVENFIGLAKQGYYDNLTFHRVIPDFMIQGGDPNGNGTGGQSLWGSPFADEFSETARHFRGALSMANSGPDTNGSQFFIVQLPAASIRASLFPAGTTADVVTAYTKQGGTPWLDGRHTVFGQVYQGMDIVDRIAGVATGAGNQPVEPVTIYSVTIEEL